MVAAAAAVVRYHARPLMAVPKQKQSHSRTSKRRAQHKAAAPGYNSCPTCHSPRLPHRVCPTCGSYKGREVTEPREQSL
jgi:large subunit ribosomal protein L32